MGSPNTRTQGATCRPHQVLEADFDGLWADLFHQEQNEEGFRVVDIKKQTGWSEARVRQMIGEAMEQGRCRSVERKIRRIDDRMTPVKFYIFSPKEGL